MRFTGDALAESIGCGMEDIDELVERSRRGDREAFRSLVDAHLDVVFRMARRLSGNDADADDLSQEAFFRAWKAIGTFRGDATFKTWICRIVMNLHATRHATDARRPVQAGLDATLAEGSEPSGHAVAVARELSQRVRLAVDALPEKQRAALSLAAYESMSVNEIAEVLGSRPETVKVNLWLARKRLREVLDADLRESTT